MKIILSFWLLLAAFGNAEPQSDFDKALASAMKGTDNLGPGADSGSYIDALERESNYLDQQLASYEKASRDEQLRRENKFDCQDSSSIECSKFADNLTACDNRNEAKACMFVGKAYEEGKVVIGDMVKANTYYKKPCSVNNSHGCFLLGKMYLLNSIEDPKKINPKASKIFKKACEQGSSKGCLELGKMYYDGTGVIQNYDKAKEYYIESCTLDESTCLILGQMYYNGNGIEHNTKKAVENYLKSCEADNYSACYALGIVYFDGKGIEKNLYKAKGYFEKSCNGGYEAGCEYYNEISKNYPNLQKSNSIADQFKAWF